MFRIKTLLVTLLLATFAFGLAQTTVPGHQDRDGTVNGNYEQVVGDYHYKVIYRGDFGDDPYLDNGSIKNIITNTVTGEKWVYTIVHETHPRYTGNGEAIWGNWEYAIGVAANQEDPADNGVFTLNRPSSHN